jgi:hypothetical protein
MPLVARSPVIKAFLLPGDVKKLQKILGLINFCQQFLPSIVWTLRPLTDAL